MVPVFSNLDAAINNKRFVIAVVFRLNFLKNNNNNNNIASGNSNNNSYSSDIKIVDDRSDAVAIVTKSAMHAFNPSMYWALA